MNNGHNMWLKHFPNNIFIFRFIIFLCCVEIISHLHLASCIRTICLMIERPIDGRVQCTRSKERIRCRLSDWYYGWGDEGAVKQNSWFDSSASAGVVVIVVAAMLEFSDRIRNIMLKFMLAVIYRSYLLLLKLKHLWMWCNCSIQISLTVWAQLLFHSHTRKRTILISYLSSHVTADDLNHQLSSYTSAAGRGRTL